MNQTTVCQQQQRLANVNTFIRFIGDHGRQFFKRNDRYACMELDNRGRVWFIDDYTQARIYTHYRWQWRGFSHGGTMRRLITVFRDHIKKGQLMNPKYFDPSPLAWAGHIWGYPEADMAAIKAEANRLGIIEFNQEEATSSDATA